MDVFEALGLDLPDTTRSMSVTADADAELMQFLAPVFGWDAKDASANSLILFPGESHHGAGDCALQEAPSINAPFLLHNEAPDHQMDGQQQPVGPASARASPFSGMTQFDLFLGDAPDAAQAGADAAGIEAAVGATLEVTEPVGADAVEGVGQSPLAQQADAVGTNPQQGPATKHELHHEFMNLLTGDPEQLQAHPEQPPPQQPQEQHHIPTAPLHLQQQHIPTAPLPPQPQPPLLAQPLEQHDPGAMALLPPAAQQPPLVSPLLLQQQGELQLQQLHQLSPALSPFTLPMNQQVPMAVLQMSQQVLQQRQTVQQQPYAFTSAPVSPHPDSDDANNHKQQRGQYKRRGRPPKVAGQYSKGYEAIKRYREKKKNMVELMEQEVAQKRAELERLEAEHNALTSHQQALESTMNTQDRTLAQLLQAKLSFASRDDTLDSKPDLETTTAAALAGVRQAIAMQNGGDPSAAASPEPTPGPEALAANRASKLKAKERAVQEKMMLEGPVFLKRYQAYVQAAADKLTHAGPVSGVGGRVSQSFPPFPFTLVETLSLWKLSRLAIMTGDALKHKQKECGEVWDDYTLNLSTGRHDKVPNSLWKYVASQVALFGDQAQQLAAAWKMYAETMASLNAERHDLLLKLQEAAAAEDVGTSPAGGHGSPGTAAAAAAAGGGEASGSGTSTGPGEAAAAAAAGVKRSISSKRRTSAMALNLALVYTELLDSIERNLLRGRAVVMMFGWSMLCMLNAEQVGRIAVVSWPYFPLIRAVVGYMLGKEDFTP